MRARSSLDIVAMVTMFDEEAARSRSHGLRPAVLTAQAGRLGLRQVIGRCTWQTYDAEFSRALSTLAADGITHVVFGDILFAEHREWAERMCLPGVDEEELGQRIIELVRRAQESKTEIQRLADQVVSWFVPAVLAVAGATLFVWGLAENDWGKRPPNIENDEYLGGRSVRPTPQSQGTPV
jgi:hypothetical protein